MENCGFENIEVRSDKVKSIIGNIPVSLFKYEAIIVLLLISILIVLFSCTTYNESFTVRLEFSGDIKRINRNAEFCGFTHYEYADSTSNRLKFIANVSKDIATKTTLGQKVEINAKNHLYIVFFEAIVSRIYTISEIGICKIELECENFIDFNELFFDQSEFEGKIILADQPLYKSFIFSKIP